MPWVWDIAISYCRLDTVDVGTHGRTAVLETTWQLASCSIPFSMENHTHASIVSSMIWQRVQNLLHGLGCPSVCVLLPLPDNIGAQEDKDLDEWCAVSDQTSLFSLTSCRFLTIVHCPNSNTVCRTTPSWYVQHRPFSCMFCIHRLVKTVFASLIHTVPRTFHMCHFVSE